MRINKKMKTIKIILTLLFLLVFLGKLHSEEDIQDSVKKEYQKFQKKFNSSKIIIKCKRIFGEKYLKYKIEKIYKGTEEEIKKTSDKDGYLKVKYKREPDDKKRYRPGTNHSFFFYEDLKGDNPRYSISYSGILNDKLDIGFYSLDMKLLSDPDKMNKKLEELYKRIEEDKVKLEEMKKKRPHNK